MKYVRSMTSIIVMTLCSATLSAMKPIMTINIPEPHNVKSPINSPIGRSVQKLITKLEKPTVSTNKITLAHIEKLKDAKNKSDLTNALNNMMKRPGGELLLKAIENNTKVDGKLFLDNHANNQNQSTKKLIQYFIHSPAATLMAIGNQYPLSNFGLSTPSTPITPLKQ